MAKLTLFSKIEKIVYSHFLLNITHSILPSCSIHSQCLQLCFSSGKTLLCSKGDAMLPLPPLSPWSRDGRASGAGSRTPHSCRALRGAAASIWNLPAAPGICQRLWPGIMVVKTSLFLFRTVVGPTPKSWVWLSSAAGSSAGFMATHLTAFTLP